LNSQLSFLFFIIALLQICISCDTTDPPDNKSLTLKLEDVSCTEAWIELTTTNLSLPATLTLKQTDPTGNSASQILNLNTKDSLLYIDSLLPNQTYKYKLSSIQHQVSSNELSITTLDTTSQNFSFEILEFGDGFESSYFNDVWIFNSDDIWVCGNVFTNDSTDGNLYQWNGSYWKAHRLNFVDMEGIWGIDTIMYLASGGLWKYDRVNLIRQNIEGTFSQGQSVHKLWGSSESNIYGVGPWGTIVRYDGTQWTKIEFDTQWSFFGITGNKETGVAYAVARNTTFSCLIVELDNSIPDIIYNSDNYINKLKSYDVDMIRKDVLILSDSDIWKFNIKTQTDEIVEDLPSGYYLPRLTSSASNDVYFFGNKLQDGERMLHYNGVIVTEFNLPSRGYVIYGGAHSVNNLAAMAAFSDNKAYLILVRR
jgi:hypothetical protein